MIWSLWWYTKQENLKKKKKINNVKSKGNKITRQGKNMYTIK